MIACQISTNWLSPYCASSFGFPSTSRSPRSPRISRRFVTGNIAWAARMLGTAGSSVPAGVTNACPAGPRGGGAEVGGRGGGGGPGGRQDGCPGGGGGGGAEPRARPGAAKKGEKQPAPAVERGRRVPRDELAPGAGRP